MSGRTPKRAKPNRPKACPFVGKGGLKLRFALERFQVNVGGLIAADLGCHVGGFTDCLLQAGAAKVFAVDTAYGTFAWKLRTDARVALLERTNALHWRPPEPVDLVVIDLGWTPQRLSLPAAAEMLKAQGEILSLVKSQYEVPKDWLRRGVLPAERLEEALALVRSSVTPRLVLIGEALLPYPGSGGNEEVWFRLTTSAAIGSQPIEHE